MVSSAFLYAFNITVHLTNISTCHDRIDSIDIDLSIRFPAIYGDPPISHLPSPTLPPPTLPHPGNRQVRFDRSDRRSDSMPVFSVGWLSMFLQPHTIKKTRTLQTAPSIVLCILWELQALTVPLSCRLPSRHTRAALMGISQNGGPILVSLDVRCRNIIYTQKRAIPLRIAHLVLVLLG